MNVEKIRIGHYQIKEKYVLASANVCLGRKTIEHVTYFQFHIYDYFI